MWKITNKQNEIILNDFRKELIKPIFKEIINYKKHYTKFPTFLEYIKSNIILYPNKKALYDIVLKRSKKKKKLHEYLEEFSSKALPYMEQQYKIYIFQNNQLDLKKYNITEYLVDENLKFIFIEFYYERFFKDSTIWNEIKNTYVSYSRIEFHKNFCEENKLTVCPYCDIDTLHNIGNREVEHFLPKSKYPFLSIHPYNLISSCHSCNTYEGKKTEYYMPITSPYNLQIGDEIKFKIDDSNEIVSIEQEKNKDLSNYLSLLNLYDRYKNNHEIYNTVEGRAKTLYSIYMEDEDSGAEIDSIIFDKYMNFKRETLTFAIKSIYENIQQYRKYRGRF